MGKETCSLCGFEIAPNEAAYIFNDEVVCAECHRLNAAGKAAPSASRAPGEDTSVAPRDAASRGAPQPEEVAPDPPLAPEQTRVCESCAQTVPAQALKCPKCQEWRKDVARDRSHLAWEAALAGASFLFLLWLRLNTNMPAWYLIGIAVGGVVFGAGARHHARNLQKMNALPSWWLLP